MMYSEWHSNGTVHKMSNKLSLPFIQADRGGPPPKLVLENCNAHLWKAVAGKASIYKQEHVQSVKER